MKKIIPLFAMMSTNLFFVISAIIGYSYEGKSESKVYIIYCFIVAIISIAITLKLLLFSKININYKILLALSSPFIITFIYMMSILFHRSGSKLRFDFFKYALLWIVPAIYAGLYVVKKNILLDILKWIEIIMIIFSLSIIFTAFLPFLNGDNFESIGGATYQSASYISAFSYGLNLYFIFLSDKKYRFKFTNNIIYKFISLVLILIQLLGIFISGGRGGIVLCLIYTIYILVTVLKTRSISRILRLIIIGVVLSITIYQLILILMNNEIFFNGFNRVFDFISPKGIDWNGTSGRDEIYFDVINLIIKKPILGYGLYNFIDVCGGYPHNIILEILLNGGFVYLTISLIFFINLIKKLKKIIKINNELRILSILLIYSMTMLMFSGSYMRSSELWFLISTVIFYEITDNKVIGGEENRAY